MEARSTSFRIGYQTNAAAAVLILSLLCATATRAQEPDRSKPPAIGPSPGLSLPAIQRGTLSNGAPVLLMEKHNVPLVQITAIFRAGTVTESDTKTGLAGLAAAMLTEGAGSRDALAFADAVDFLGATISAQADRHSVTVKLHAPVAVLDEALDLWADALQHPKFNGAELERLRKEHLTNLAQFHDEPALIATVACQQILYGRKHPYGVMRFGTEASLRGITTEDLKGFQRGFLHPANCTIVIAGDVTMDAARKKLEARLGSWKAGNAVTISVPASEQVKDRAVYLIDKPGAPQSEIRIGRIGVERTSKDYFPLVVMNTILGGSFSSRLNQNLRERNGYTYGARSSFQFQPKPGPFIASAAVQTEVTDKALTEFFNELKAIIASVSDEEMTRARNYVAYGYPSNFETVDGIASALQEVSMYGLPDDYFNGFIGRVLAVTKDDVLRVARAYIDPERVAVVIVGDKATIEQSLRSLKLGPVNAMSIPDVLGPVPVIGKP